jgi:hypothetical protein
MSSLKREEWWWQKFISEVTALNLGWYAEKEVQINLECC